jgi:thymidylate kinase
VLINLRGPSGSGKSTAVRAVMKRATFRPIYGVLFGLRCPEAYQARLPQVDADTFVLGPYRTPCGGCDAIASVDMIIALVERYARRGHVVFEGMMISSGFSRVGELLAASGDAVVLFLDTPAAVCIERVNARRSERGDARPFDPRHLLQNHARIAALKDKLTAAGTLRVLSINAEEAADVIIRLLAGR